MDIPTYISKQPAEWQALLKSIHAIIQKKDKTVVATIEPMMGKEMIIYKGRGMMKYGLSGVKNYMSFHVLPIYGSPVLHERYKKLLPHAKFQKGCINFTGPQEMPLDVVEKLITDCAPLDLVKMREKYLAERKAAKKK
jgi:hypothetical protein